jgi:hypothetical protein
MVEIHDRLRESRRDDAARFGRAGALRRLQPRHR